MRRSGKRDHQCFAENQNGDIFRAESQRFHDRVVAGSFARGHGHRVGDHGHDDENDDKRHHLNRRDNGFAHGDEAQIEGLFRFRKRLGQRIFKCLVNSDSRVRRQCRPGHADHVKTNLVSIGGRHIFLIAFIQIHPVKEKLGFINRIDPGLYKSPAEQNPSYPDRSFL